MQVSGLNLILHVPAKTPGLYPGVFYFINKIIGFILQDNKKGPSVETD